VIAAARRWVSLRSTHPTDYGIDAHAIIAAAEAIAPGRPIRHLGVV
jgi:hypothetical protein